MVKNIDINKFLFGSTSPQKKLETIKALGDSEVRKVTSETMLRIYKECNGGGDKFRINSDRAVGNDWDSTIEFLYEYRGKPYLCLYVQSSSSDSSTCVSYSEFVGCSRYNGYCVNLNKYFQYDSADIVNTIRCILSEYIYYKYIEREERERQRLINGLMNWKVINPIFNYYYKYLRLSNLPFSYATTKAEYKSYCNGKKGVTDYIRDHADELIGKSDEELSQIYKEVFRRYI